MDQAGARTRLDWVIRAFGRGKEALAALGLDAEAEARCAQALSEKGDLAAAAGPHHERWALEAAVKNLEAYAGLSLASGRYERSHHEKPPKKLGTKLHLFDCITCDKCIPVCPNDANFALYAPRTEIPIVKVRREGEAWVARREGILRLDEKHQLGNYADHCNDCGNCDVFCPEEGGPYRVKPRFFGSIASYAEARGDGFYLERRAGRDLVLGRFEGRELRVEIEGERVLYEGTGFRVTFSEPDPEGTMAGVAEGEVDLTYFRIMDLLRQTIFSSAEPSWVSCLWEAER